MTEHEQQQQQSLAELCSICYSDKPKYRCPRCKTQTCSLPCYKRHQQRASCNGQRDPAAYMKRSAWATPAGIDHDYNYLKSVERKVEVASQDVKERGISVRNPAKGGSNAMGQKPVAKAWMPGSQLQRYLAEHAIHVEKAPTGMSRQRANRTRTTNKGKVMWTVEWVQSDGIRSVDSESFCESSIGQLWKVIEAKKANAEQGKKRKRTAAGSNQDPTKSATSGAAKTSRRLSRTVLPAFEPIFGTKDEKTDEEKQKMLDQDDVRKNDSKDSDGEPQSAHVKQEDFADGEDEQPPAEAKNVDLLTQDHEDGEQPKIIRGEPITGSTTADITIQNDRRPPQSYFYLLKPLTASNRRVVIPIDPTATLTACLKGRTVLEYPTIYVLPEEPEALPAGYQLQESYTKSIIAEQREVDKLLDQSRNAAGVVAHPAEANEKSLDANSILDMLQRDLGG